MDNSTRRTLATAIPVAVATGLLLAGCSAGPADPGAGSGSGSDRSSSGSSSSQAADGELAKIGAAAEKAAGSGTIISIERESSGTWEVLLADAKGAETELHLTADGATTAGPSSKPGDAEDASENRTFLAAAKLGYAEAAEKIGAAQAGTLTELNLDDHLGAIVWEGDVLDSSNTKHSVKIDAGSGKVVDTTTDTSDDD